MKAMVAVAAHKPGKSVPVWNDKKRLDKVSHSLQMKSGYIMDALITVVIPVYNMGHLLPKAIDSLLAQSYKKFEAIIVDDGSNDGSDIICEQQSTRDDRFRVIHKENGGLSSARNCGIKNARGEFVIFPDPDDWVDVDYLSSLIALKQEFPDYLPTIGYYIDSDQISKTCKQYPNKLMFEGERALIALLQSNYYCGFTVNKLFDLNLIREYELSFDEDLGRAQDLLFSFQYISICGKVIYDSKPKYHYFQHFGGVTNAGISKRNLSVFLTYERLNDQARLQYPKVANMAKATKANVALALIDTFFNGTDRDANILNLLHGMLKENCTYLLRSHYHGLIRKMEASLALISPSLYYQTRKCLKRRIK